MHKSQKPTRLFALSLNCSLNICILSFAFFQYNKSNQGMKKIYRTTPISIKKSYSIRYDRQYCMTFYCINLFILLYDIWKVWNEVDDKLTVKYDFPPNNRNARIAEVWKKNQKWIRRINRSWVLTNKYRDRRFIESYLKLIQRIVSHDTQIERALHIRMDDIAREMLNPTWSYG